jgi:hypothetical protein
MILYLFAVLALGLMCGSELNVAAFAHPTLERQPPGVRIVAIVLREPIWPRNAVLDGRFYTAEPFATIAVRTPW